VYAFSSRDVFHGVLVRLTVLLVESDAGAERIGRGFPTGENCFGCGFPFREFQSLFVPMGSGPEVLESEFLEA